MEPVINARPNDGVPSFNRSLHNETQVIPRISATSILIISAAPVSNAAPQYNCKTNPWIQIPTGKLVFSYPDGRITFRNRQSSETGMGVVYVSDCERSVSSPLQGLFKDHNLHHNQHIDFHKPWHFSALSKMNSEVEVVDI